MAETLTETQKNKDAIIAEIEKKITDAFDLFDYEANKTVDVREVGTVMRSLGCCPTEADLREIVAKIEDEESTGYVPFEKFLPMMTEVLMEGKFKPASDEELMTAFQVLDVENRGYLLKEEMSKYMTEEGEPFKPEELEEMMSQALDKETGHIPYKKYTFVLLPDDLCK